MKFAVREALKRARQELDAAIETLENAELIPGDDDDLVEVRARLAVLETRVSVIESRRESR